MTVGHTPKGACVYVYCFTAVIGSGLPSPSAPMSVSVLLPLSHDACTANRSLPYCHASCLDSPIVSGTPVATLGFLAAIWTVPPSFHVQVPLVGTQLLSVAVGPGARIGDRVSHAA